MHRALACDVTAAMLVFQDKRILMRCFCQVLQYGRHLLCDLVPQGLSANALLQMSVRFRYDVDDTFYCMNVIIVNEID